MRELELQDEMIVSFQPYTLLSQEVIYSLFDEQNETERTRLMSLMAFRAKELGIEREFRTTMKAFVKADKQLEQEYTIENAKNKINLKLKFNSYGKPLSTVENFLIVLRNDPFFKGLNFNLLTYSPEVEVEDGKPRRWTDTDDSIAREYIETKYQLHCQQKLDDALRIIFKERSYHPIKQIIESVKWDRVERISTFLTKWMKCEESEYSQEVSRLIFAGGINRLYNPGCKFDDVPILIGTKQGEGKSTLVRWLSLRDEFFTEITEVEGQKGMESLEGAWICEIAELLAMTKAKEIEAVKSYITRQVDRYRRPFDKRVTEHRRQCVFVGTTNKAQFLTDKTGNRRFYPIKVNQSGYDLFNFEKEIREEIKQCWAEAKAKFDKGEMLPFADKKLLKVFQEYQNEAVEDDYRCGLITDYLEKREEVCILEIWERALKNEYAKPTKKDSNDIALILQSMDEWKKAGIKRTQEYGVQKYWVRVKNYKQEQIQDALNDGKLPFEV